MFRYERSQAGRYRQHHQFGVEAIGSAQPQQDAEAIHLLWTLYARLGLKGLTLHLNSIGDAEARASFRHALKMYLRPHLDDLSADSQERYETNPLRILDSKDHKDQKWLHDAPHIMDFLNPASKAHFETVCQLLTAIGIPYQINHRLVRGLDYYNNTVFEITSTELGAQNSLGGGGRYDGLIQQLGGPTCQLLVLARAWNGLSKQCLPNKPPFPLLPRIPLFFDPAWGTSLFRVFQAGLRNARTGPEG